MITPMALIGIQRESGMLSPNEVFLAQMITKGPRAMNAVQATARRTLDSPLNPFQPLSDLPHTFSFASPLYAGLGVLRLPSLGLVARTGRLALAFAVCYLANRCGFGLHWIRPCLTVLFFGS